MQLAAWPGRCALVVLLGVGVHMPSANGDEGGASPNGSARILIDVVTEKGFPIAGLEVGRRRAGESAWDVVRTDGEGRAEFKGVVRGKHVVRLLGTGSASEAVPIEKTVEIEARDEKREVHLSARTDEMLVLSIPGVRARLAKGQGLLVYIFCADKEVAFCGESILGETRILGLPRGYDLDVLLRSGSGNLQGYVSQVRAGPDSVGVEVATGMGIRGRVAGPEGTTYCRAIYRGAVFAVTVLPDRHFVLEALPRGMKLDIEALMTNEAGVHIGTAPATAGDQNVEITLRSRGWPR